MPTSPVLGLHHVTAISGPPQQTVDFYNGLLGLRFVKKTVNYDDPGTYHLYVADGEARPGSFMTFFPWGDRGMRGRRGAPQVLTTAYAAPEGAVDYWEGRFADAGHDTQAVTEHFGRRVLPFYDPDGLHLEIVETPEADGAWASGPIPTEAALGAFYGVSLGSSAPEQTERVLTQVLGYEEANFEDGRVRFTHPEAQRASVIDLVRPPTEAQGRMGTGTIHHVAFRVPDEAAQQTIREALIEHGLQPTPVIDRQYFRSVYVREPGGILFEIATDAPGFAVDEPADRLGHELVLPPQHEHLRARLTDRLSPLHIPHPDA